MVPKKIYSLVLLRKSGFVLLGWKKRGFGAEKWNGFGGKIENGETILECAKRGGQPAPGRLNSGLQTRVDSVPGELFEESGISVDFLEKVGNLVFEFVQNPMIMDVTVYTVDQFTGEPCESEEMKPKWFAEKDIPYDEMWADDRIWFPLFLKGLKFKGHIKFLDNETILEHHIEVQV